MLTKLKLLNFLRNCLMSPFSATKTAFELRLRCPRLTEFVPLCSPRTPCLASKSIFSRRKRDIKQFLPAHKKSVLLGIIFALLVFNASFFRIIQGVKQKKTLEKQIGNIELEIKKLNTEIYNLKYNADYIESLARKNLAMFKANETIYKFKQSNTNEKNN